MNFRRQELRPDITGRAAPTGRRRWRLRTAMAAQEPRVPGASRWWAPSRAARPPLLEAILARTGAIQRQGTVEAGTTVGDASQGSAPSQDERRARRSPPRPSWATATPSSIAPARSNSSTTCARRCRRSMPRWWSARPTRRRCRSCSSSCASSKSSNIPRFLFLNKIDKAETKVMEALQLLQPASRKPLVLRQIPIWKNDIVTGFVDLALERAHVYKEHAASEVVPLEGESLEQREDRALLHAGEARRPRRRADGAIARGHSAAARQGVRRSRQGAARRPGRARC